MRPDLAGQWVLVTGGTAGVGLATGLAFGRCGARTVLTYRWGSADPDEVRAAFRQVGAPEPLLIQADIGRDEDLTALIEVLTDHTDRLHTFVANAANAVVVRELEDLSLRGLQQSMRYGAWPLVGYTLALREALGAPRYVIAMSSDGPDHFTAGYDLIAATKATTETLVRYLATRLAPEGCRVNAIRSRTVPTASFDAVFGPELRAYAEQHMPPRWWVPADEVGNAALALCSGSMDAVSGQVVTVDWGAAFADNLMRVYEATR